MGQNINVLMEFPFPEYNDVFYGCGSLIITSSSPIIYHQEWNDIAEYQIVSFIY